MTTLKGAGPVHGLRPDRRGVRRAAGGHAGDPAEAREQSEAAADSHVSRRGRQSHGVGCGEAELGEGRERRHREDRQRGMAASWSTSAHVVKTDIAASNGVIHVIDAVVLPNGEVGTGMDEHSAHRRHLDTSAAAFFDPSKKAAMPSAAWRGSRPRSRRPGRPLKWSPATASTRRRSTVRSPA